MISPADQRFIQIDITSRCGKNCSNCTRFTSHLRNPAATDISEEQFQQAVDSLVEFSGCVGIIGGEPTLHPQFDRLIAYLSKHIGLLPSTGLGRQPIADFAEYHKRQIRLFTQDGRQKVGRGLWSSLGERYVDCFEAIHDIFNIQFLNDHVDSKSCLHQALLISRSSLNIPDLQWIQLRDNCWVQNLWSATITKKGAFFCEVAGALDMLFDGPGGWPVEPGWWRRKPCDFGNQLKWCEYCSAPLCVPRRFASEGINDVSADNYRRLLGIGSPSVAAGMTKIFAETDYDPDRHRNEHTATGYIVGGDRSSLVSTQNRSLHMRRLEGVLVCIGYDDFLAWTLPQNIQQFDRFVVVTTPDDKATQGLAKKCGATLVVSDRGMVDGLFCKGAMINDGVVALNFDDWVVFTDADVLLPAGLRASLQALVLNPGCLHYTTRLEPPLSERTSWLHSYAANQSDAMNDLAHRPEPRYQAPWGYFQLFNCRAQAIAGKGRKLLSEWRLGASEADTEFARLWPESKQILLPQKPEFQVIHIPHGPRGVNWDGRLTPRLSLPINTG